MDEEVEKLITAAIDAISGAGAENKSGLGTPTLDHRLRTAITIVRENGAEKITVEDIAVKVGLSRAHFFTLFRDQLNTTPQVFWSAVRVEEGRFQE